MRKDLFRCYSSDASRMKGKVEDVLHPRSVEEVCKMVRENGHVVIRGAGTGLAGGAVPQGDVVLDLSKLRGIMDFDLERRSVVVEAGVVLDDLQDFLSKRGNLEFPVKPSSHAACTLGGMVATNAVGNRGVRYGNVSEWVRWVDVVDGLGRVERKGVTEMSDYVGLEGITGVVVRVCLKLDERKDHSASLFRLDSVEDVVRSVLRFKQRRDVSGLEFMDRLVSKGVGLDEGYYLLVEFEGDEGKLKGEGYEKVMAKRDAVYPFVAGEGFCRIEDPKVMVSKLPELLGWLEKNGVPTFGHIGTGILHPCFSVEQERLIPEMMKLVVRLGGKVSGEHGVGLLKRKFVEANDRKILLNVKKRLDSEGKFNRGKVV
jgi:glycolate oxidase